MVSRRRRSSSKRTGAAVPLIIVLVVACAMVMWMGREEEEWGGGNLQVKAMEETVVVDLRVKTIEETVVAVHAAADIFMASLHNKTLTRIVGLAQQHQSNGRPHAVGLRGVSWLYANLNNALIAAPEFERQLKHGEFLTGDFTIRFTDIAHRTLNTLPCPAEMANRVTIWVRLAGPEVLVTLAEPQLGQCAWVASFHITVPGTYTAYARLLHFDGTVKPTSQLSCEAVKPQNISIPRLSVLHYIQPSFRRYEPNCCSICMRFRDCAYSTIVMNGTWRSQSYRKTYDIAHCMLFKHDDETVLIDLETQLQQLKITTTLSKQLKHASIWQLGCGRDEILQRWAPCGNFGSEYPAIRGEDRIEMLGTEDILLFEASHKFTVKPSSLPMPVTSTLDYFYRENEALSTSVEYRPICKWSKSEHRIIEFAHARWVMTSPPQIYTERCDGECGNKRTGIRYNAVTGNTQVTVTDCNATLIENGHIGSIMPVDPLCWTRFDMASFPLSPLLWVTFPGEEFFHVWRSEISDSYFRTIKPPGLPPPWSMPSPWGGRWVSTSPSCRLHPLRTPSQVRECLDRKGVRMISLWGRSVMEILATHIRAILFAAYAKGTELKCDPRFCTQFEWLDQNRVGNTTVFVTTLAAPWLVWNTDDAVRQSLQGHVKDYDNKYTIKMWMSLPFLTWERRQFMTQQRAKRFQEMFREELRPKGWLELDLLSTSQAMIFDSAYDVDTVHVMGHCMVEVAHLFIDGICRYGDD